MLCFFISNILNSFSLVDQDRCFCEQCRSRRYGLQWTISPGSTLFIILFLIYNCQPFGITVQMQRWKCLFQSLRVKRVERLQIIILLVVSAIRKQKSNNPANRQWASTRERYLSHRRPTKTQARLLIKEISPEPLLFADMYSRTSLSRTRLFRITAYLEWKSGSCFNTKLW